MAQTTIEWTATRLPGGTVLPGYTFNPWWGCVKVSEACTNCYAETWAKRTGWDVWGPPGTTPRRFFGEKKWAEPRRWNARAEQDRVRRKVFCASMSDVFEMGPMPGASEMDYARDRLWSLIEETPWLDWLLLTKRPENIVTMVPSEWTDGDWPANAWAGTTVESQEWAEKRIPHLLRVPAPVRFLSCEPLVGPVDLSLVGYDSPNGGMVLDTLSGEAVWSDTGCLADWDTLGMSPIDWVITGGESGPKARPAHPAWYRSLRDQCRAAGVAFHFKQWGEWCPQDVANSERAAASALYVDPDGSTRDARYGTRRDAVTVQRVGKTAAGRVLDGRTWDEFPEVANADR